MIDPRRAWEPYRPTADNPWDLRKVGHLYRRAAFGATWDESASRPRRRARENDRAIARRRLRRVRPSPPASRTAMTARRSPRGG